MFDAAHLAACFVLSFTSATFEVETCNLVKYLGTAGGMYNFTFALSFRNPLCSKRIIEMTSCEEKTAERSSSIPAFMCFPFKLRLLLRSGYTFQLWGKPVAVIHPSQVIVVLREAQALF